MTKTIAILIAAASLFLAGCSTTHCSKSCNYEYKTVSAYVNSDLETRINALAKDGWRVVSSVGREAHEVQGDKVVVIMERCKR